MFSRSLHISSLLVSTLLSRAIADFTWSWTMHQVATWAWHLPTTEDSQLNLWGYTRLRLCLHSSICTLRILSSEIWNLTMWCLTLKATLCLLTLVCPRPELASMIDHLLSVAQLPILRLRCSVDQATPAALIGISWECSFMRCWLEFHHTLTSKSQSSLRTFSLVHSRYLTLCHRMLGRSFWASSIGIQARDSAQMTMCQRSRITNSSSLLTGMQLRLAREKYWPQQSGPSSSILSLWSNSLKKRRSPSKTLLTSREPTLRWREAIRATSIDQPILRIGHLWSQPLPEMISCEQSNENLTRTIHFDSKRTSRLWAC